MASRFWTIIGAIPSSSSPKRPDGRKEKSEANFALSTSLPEFYFFFFAGFLAAFLVFFAAFFFAAIFTHLHPTE
jgi:hypothetical protein